MWHPAPGRRVLLAAICTAASFLTLFCSGPVRADFSFVQITDTHIVAGATDQGHNGAVSACLKEIAALQPAPAFLAHTGDVTETGSPAEFAAYRAMIGALPRTLPTYVAPGNHDVRWIAPSRDGFRLATGNRPYQSWDYQNVHFVLLDSTVPLEHWGHFDAAELAWLAQDLRRNGTARPVVIGFHHWIGRESLMVDNEDALLAVIAPYNVRLFLIGHGHADIQWNVNGIPAIMAKGLYQGSYNLVRVTRDRLQVLRRTTTDTAPVKPILTVSLGRPAAPEFRWLGARYPRRRLSPAGSIRPGRSR
jgi:Icc protein